MCIYIAIGQHSAHLYKNLPDPATGKRVMWRLRSPPNAGSGMGGQGRMDHPAPGKPAGPRTTYINMYRS